MHMKNMQILYEIYKPVRKKKCTAFSCIRCCIRIITSQDNSGRKEPLKASSPSSCPKQVQLSDQTKLLGDAQGLKSSKHRGSTPSWDDLLYYLTVLLGKYFPPISDLNLFCVYMCPLSLTLPPCSTMRSPVSSHR